MVTENGETSSDMQMIGAKAPVVSRLSEIFPRPLKHHTETVSHTSETKRISLAADNNGTF